VAGHAHAETPPLRTAGWLAIGGGAAIGIGGATVSWLKADDAIQKARAGDQSKANDVDTYKTTGKIFAVVGAGLVATGITLVLVAKDEEQVAVVAGPGGLSISGTF
jgi:hypothetical protein